MEWDCREAAKNYVNISSVLAGFAFAAVILAIQTPVPENVDALFFVFKNLTSIAFLIGFFGCVVSSFTFSLISGEVRVVSRTLTLLMLGGSGFSIAGGYIFWGLSTTTSWLLTDGAAMIAFCIFLCIALLVPIYLISILVDIDQHIQKSLSKRGLFNLIFCGYAFILAGILLRILTPISLKLNSIPYFYGVAYLALFLIVFSVVITAVASYSQDSFRLSNVQSLIWLAIHSFVYGALILMTP